MLCGVVVQILRALTIYPIYDINTAEYTTRLNFNKLHSISGGYDATTITSPDYRPVGRPFTPVSEQKTTVVLKLWYAYY